MRSFSGLLLCLLGVTACAKHPAEAPGSAAVVLSDAAPPEGFARLGPLNVVSGKGCGMMGEPGSEASARVMLKNKAHRLGATYVHVTRYDKPPLNHQCMEHEHKLAGEAYRPLPPAGVPSASPPDALSPPPASAPPASAPPSTAAVAASSQPKAPPAPAAPAPATSAEPAPTTPSGP